MRRSGLPLLLYSYIAAELLAPFFAGFLILYSVFFLVRLIPLLEVVLDLGIGLADFVRLFAYIFPHLLLYVIPMAAMTGVIIGFTRLTNEREILALKACGISLRQMLPPVVMLAAAIAVLTGWFSVRLIPAGEVALRQLMYQLAKEKIDRGIKEKQFTEALGEVVVYVDETAADGQWQGVYVSDMRGREQPIIIMAKSGQMQADIRRMAVTIVLEQGTLHSTSGLDSQTVRFRRYRLQIPLKPPTRIDGDDITRLSRGSMSQGQLQEAARRKGGVWRRDGLVYLTEYHHRLAMPVGCLLLSLLGLPLGLQAGPGRRAAGFPLGLACFVLYYILSSIARVMVEDMTLPLTLGMWLPNLLFAGLTVLIFRRAEQEQPLIPERLTALAALAGERLAAPLQQLRRRLAGRGSQTAAAAAAEAMLVHAEPDSGIFHLPGCRLYRSRRSSLAFRDIRVAKRAGFRPCPRCARHNDP